MVALLTTLPFSKTFSKPFSFSFSFIFSLGFSFALELAFRPIGFCWVRIFVLCISIVISSQECRLQICCSHCWICQLFWRARIDHLFIDMGVCSLITCIHLAPFIPCSIVMIPSCYWVPGFPPIVAGCVIAQIDLMAWHIFLFIEIIEFSILIIIGQVSS